MWDPFDYVDRLINGLCYFIYNFAFSVIELLRNPAKGVLRLSSRFRTKGARQASDYTLIFFVAVVSSVLLHAIWSLDGVMRYQSYTTTIEKIGAEVYERSFGSAVATTLILAVFVLLLYQSLLAHVRTRIPAGRGNKLRIRFGYYCCYLFLVLVIAEAVASLLLTVTNVNKDFNLIVALGSFPAILALGGLIGRRAVPAVEPRTTFLIVVMLFIGQTGGAGFALLYSRMTRADQISISAVTCKGGQTNKLRVVAVVANGTDRALIIKHSGILIVGEMVDRSDKLYFDIVEPSRAATPFILLPAKQSVPLNIEAKLIGDADEVKFFHCWLSIRAVDKDVSDDGRRFSLAKGFQAAAYDFGQHYVGPTTSPTQPRPPSKKGGHP